MSFAASYQPLTLSPSSPETPCRTTHTKSVDQIALYTSPSTTTNTVAATSSAPVIPLPLTSSEIQIRVRKTWKSYVISDQEDYDGAEAHQAVTVDMSAAPFFGPVKQIPIAKIAPVQITRDNDVKGCRVHHHHSRNEATIITTIALPISKNHHINRFEAHFGRPQKDWHL